MTDIELKVWEIIKDNPGELGFILQEKNYQMYCDTFNDEKPILTEEQYTLVKDYFTQRGFWYEDSD